jgi:ElaB/YqjD/DUF883 family membrane-anchored ribosome-binding protein
MNMKRIDPVNMDNAKDREWPTRDLLTVIADAESILIERSRRKAEDADEYVHDNRWNWH